jgi:hypothetical protein
MTKNLVKLNLAKMAEGNEKISPLFIFEFIDFSRNF